MRHKKSRGLTKIVMMLVLLILFPIEKINAESNQAETEVSIGFTGYYHPIGNPDPVPPKEIKNMPIKDRSSFPIELPKTNSIFNNDFIRSGFYLIIFTLIIWQLRKKIRVKIKKESGIY